MADTYRGRNRKKINSARQMQGSIANMIENQSVEVQEDLDLMVEKILDKIGSEAVIQLRELVIKYFYDKVLPSVNYTRMEDYGGFLDTIRYKKVKNSKGKYSQIELYCNWKKLYSSPVPQGDDAFNPHAGFDGKKFTEGLYEYVIQGIYKPPFGGIEKRKTISGSDYNGMEEEMNKELTEFYNKRTEARLSAYMKKYFGAKQTSVKYRIKKGKHFSV